MHCLCFDDELLYAFATCCFVSCLESKEIRYNTNMELVLGLGSEILSHHIGPPQFFRIPPCKKKPHPDPNNR